MSAADEAVRQLQEVVDGLLTGASSHADCIELADEGRHGGQG